jgi:hypothetical protein
LPVKHGLKQVSVADLIAYRQRKETLIEHIDSFDVETVAGKAKAYSYTLPWDPMHHLAVVFGDIRDGVDVPVRLHLESVVDDVFSKEKPMTAIMERMARKAAASSSICARARLASASRRRGACPHHRGRRTMPKRRRARTNGWKSGLAHRF